MFVYKISIWIYNTVAVLPFAKREAKKKFGEKHLSFNGKKAQPIKITGKGIMYV